ncbi:hypothetical protein Amal_03998 [Acetobacter malorum]|uniref:Uncharacterized protein n=1 Tax=Acetobacter malorum TaxID=178901 RepID=A0A177FZ95_9PROT|nr:hypothetical protein Amal_03998 [Acetobacter malorum]
MITDHAVQSHVSALHRCGIAATQSAVGVQPDPKAQSAQPPAWHGIMHPGFEHVARRKNATKIWCVRIGNFCIQISIPKRNIEVWQNITVNLRFPPLSAYGPGCNVKLGMFRVLHRLVHIFHSEQGG